MPRTIGGETTPAIAETHFPTQLDLLFKNKNVRSLEARIFVTGTRGRYNLCRRQCPALAHFLEKFFLIFFF